MFETFAEYMYSLLSTPFKRVKKSVNQFWIFLKVMALLFDELNNDIYLLREQMSILTCNEALLDVYGEDYDLPRLKGEDIENYRKRLVWKKKTATLGGTRAGILEVLASLGYGESKVFPAIEIDSKKWAEFYILLKRNTDTGINDLRILYSEINKVKQASSRPQYMIDGGNQLQIKSTIYSLIPDIPICGLLVCGTWPEEI